MTFDELEVGKEYANGFNTVLRVLDRTSDAISLRFMTGICATGNPYITVTRNNQNVEAWRLYVPPPEPVVRYAYARLYTNDTVGSANASSDEGHATNDPRRIGPVVRIELPVCPDMLARVRDGAK